ncbi:hypothetical protein [Catenibacterium mitsuokai]|uniref:hypothetical protein n=1 Tax=Catenibacterium mitsuokai TaxID=100886 RepID=UPI001C212312|nr:hypothetical protein [Catenibacterium mitsuokai]MBU9057300.1 hypothetical protein [Catenibacterium mitsuokai]MCB5427994.1 hypothetical protein [Catenibacterium mitsuokai]
MILEQLNMLESTTDRESYIYRITHYLLENRHSIIEYKVNDILEDLDISKSTLRRYSIDLGYKNFTAVQYQLYYEFTTRSFYRAYTSDDKLWEIVKDKRRIIVLGDESSIAPLLVYKQIFRETKLPIDFQMYQSFPMKQLMELDVTEEDIVFFVSLFHSNLAFEVGYLDDYFPLMESLKERGIEHLYIGKVAKKKELEENYTEINEKCIADRIHHLCMIFENLYGCLDNIQK